MSNNRNEHSQEAHRLTKDNAEKQFNIGMSAGSK
jgi:hypothetical protein